MKFDEQIADLERHGHATWQDLDASQRSRLVRAYFEENGEWGDALFDEMKPVFDALEHHDLADFGLAISMKLNAYVRPYVDKQLAYKAMCRSAEPTQLPMIAPSVALTPVELLQIAVQKGVDTEQLKALMQMERDYKADRARDAFHSAMNAFRAESIKIVKRKAVSFNDTNYKHATLADIVEASVPFLSKHGLSHRWETKQDGPSITVACVVTHELGHSAQTSLTAGPDDSGKKNKIQAIGSTVSYLQRYTFMAITGLAAKDQDDDGHGAGDADLIDEKQAAELEALISEVGANKAAFLKTCKVDRIEDLPASKYQGAVARLEAKRTEKRGE